MPPVSPAGTMATYSSLKTFGCLASDWDSEMPASTFLRTSPQASASLSLSVCSSTT